MRCFLRAVISVLLLELVSSHVIPAKVTSRFEDDALRSHSNNDTLIFAHVLFRHGERNIAYVYPNDPFKDEIHWPGGLGQLTNVGKQQLYELGQYFRRRYGQLLGDKYSANKIYVRSTDFDRTLASAQVNLAGLFVPTEEEKWNDQILWQPIPVHTMPKQSDYVLAGEKYCPKYEAALKQYLKDSPEVQHILKNYADHFVYWSQMSGSKIKTIRDVYSLHNTLSIEKDRNKPLAKWAEKAVEPNGIMENIAKFNFKMGSNTPQIARMRPGFLVKEMLDHFSRKINSTLNPNYSLWLYSAHDFTISCVLNSLGLFELHFPPYASSLHFELYKGSGSEHYLQLFYRTSSEENPPPMNIPGCGEKCPLDKFYELYSEIIPDDFDTECYTS